MQGEALNMGLPFFAIDCLKRLFHTTGLLNRDPSLNRTFLLFLLIFLSMRLCVGLERPFIHWVLRMAKGDETRNAILRKAIGVASVSGLDGLTIGGLAKEMGLSKSGLIAHFGTKEALQLSVLQASAGMFANRVIVPARREAAGEPKLRAYFDNWIRWSHSAELPGGCLFTAASIELDDKPGICRYFLAKVQKEWAGALESAAQEAVENGDFRTNLDAGQVAFGMISILHGLHHYERLFRDRAAEPRARAAFESLIVRARKPAGEDGTRETNDRSETVNNLAEVEPQGHA